MQWWIHMDPEVDLFPEDPTTYLIHFPMFSCWYRKHAWIYILKRQKQMNCIVQLLSSFADYFITFLKKYFCLSFYMDVWVLRRGNINKWIKCVILLLLFFRSIDMFTCEKLIMLAVMLERFSPSLSPSLLPFLPPSYLLLDKQILSSAFICVCVSWRKRS